MPFENKTHHGYVFIPENSSLNFETWEPTQIISKEMIAEIPILKLPSNGKKKKGYTSFKFKCEISLPVKKNTKQSEKYSYDIDLINLVQKWVMRNEKQILGSVGNKEVIPIISFDKAIRYARTGEQTFKDKNGEYSDNGYSIITKEMPPPLKKYYQWDVHSVPGRSCPPYDEGMVFEKFIFSEFGKTKEQIEQNQNTPKKFNFYSLSSFEYSYKEKVYKFFCIGEVDGLIEMDNSIYPAEVKSCSSKNKKTIINYKLPAYMAKCTVSYIPKLIVGFCNKPFEHDKRFSACYKKIRIYETKVFIPNSNFLETQEEWLEMAVKKFIIKSLEFRKDSKVHYGFLNGFVSRKEITPKLLLNFKDTPRKIFI